MDGSSRRSTRYVSILKIGCIADKWLQGVYHALQRTVEPELFPLLRKRQCYSIWELNFSTHFSFMIRWNCVLRIQSSIRRVSQWFVSLLPFQVCHQSSTTGRYKSMDQTADKGGRFDASSGFIQAIRYRERYWHEHNFRALQIISEAAEKENLTVPQVALRWLEHHSQLKRCVCVINSLRRILIIETATLENIMTPL
jgi:aflatoxin B1 aldehyde reductase